MNEQCHKSIPPLRITEMTDHNNIEEGTPLVSYQNSDEIAPENVAETLAPRSTKLVLATIAAGASSTIHMKTIITHPCETTLRRLSYLILFLSKYSYDSCVKPLGFDSFYDCLGYFYVLDGYHRRTINRKPCYQGY